MSVPRSVNRTGVVDLLDSVEVGPVEADINVLAAVAVLALLPFQKWIWLMTVA